MTAQGDRNSQPLLEIIDLSFTHVGQKQPTLEGINLHLNPGELVVLAGATGSGKSTLLNCITGISPEHTGGKLNGRVLYRAQEITSQSIRERAKFMGIALQNVETQLFTDRVQEEIVFGLENWNCPAEEIEQITRIALIEFDLLEQQNWNVRQLSAGQKQRLLLACLLTRNPDLLLLDEPFAFLDTAGIGLLLQLLKERVKQGQSLLIIEHRLELLQGLCDRAYRIDAGSVKPCNLSDLPVAKRVLDRDRPTANKLVSTQETTIVLQTENVSWGGYPPFPDLRISIGDIVLLQGDNGCGKTTLLKLLTGLLKPQTGWLQIKGQDATGQSVIQIARTIGFVLQNPNHQLFAESVEAEVNQPGVTLARARELLEQLNLSHCTEKHPHALSQGQKRRLALGAVLARQPQICLLDEIMVGQDAMSLELMLRCLKIFTDRGGTLIFTSHDPGVTKILQPKIVRLHTNSV